VERVDANNKEISVGLYYTVLDWTEVQVVHPLTIY
jgi:hypothetical protein